MEHQPKNLSEQELLENQAKARLELDREEAKVKRAIDATKTPDSELTLPTEHLPDKAA